MKKPANVDDYIAGFPAEVQVKLEQVRAAIKAAAPQATEVISYGMPAYKQNGMLVWIGAHNHHIGVYPGASGIAAFEQELAGYKSAKGSVQFPYHEPLPLELIARMVDYRITENMKKAK